MDSRINADTEVCFRSDSARSLSRRSSVTRVGGRYTDFVTLFFFIFTTSAVSREIFIEGRRATRIVEHMIGNIKIFLNLCESYKMICCQFTRSSQMPVSRFVLIMEQFQSALFCSVFQCFFALCHFVTSAYGRHLFNDPNISQCDVSVKGKNKVFFDCRNMQLRPVFGPNDRITRDAKRRRSGYDC